MARAKGILAFTLVLAFLSPSLTEVAQRSVVPARLPKSNSSGLKPEEPLLVSTLDGKITAVDKETGEVKWSFNTESPLVSARDSRAYEFSIIPGVQGELYTQQRGNGGGFQLLPQTLPQWVEQTPAVMGDGSLWLGSRHTHAFFVDANTGKLIKSYVEYGEGPLGNSSEVADLPEDTRPILIGRVDYTVRAVHQESGEELFNVTYSRLLRLDSEQQLREAGEGRLLEGPHSDLSQLGISVDPDKKTALVRVEPGTKATLWRTDFEEPPVVLFADGRAGVSLHDQAALASDKGSLSRLGLGRAGSQSIAVDKIGSSYYALPVAEPKQPSQLSALLPAAGADDVPLKQEEASMLRASTNEQVHSPASAPSPVGVHQLESEPSPLASRNSFPPNNVTASGGSNSSVKDLGIMSVSLFTGASLIMVWVFVKVTEKPRVIASLKEHPEEDIRTLTLSYTGTTQDAYEAQKELQSVMDGDDSRSKIKDLTGSGVEHKPGEDISGSQGENEDSQDVGATPFSTPDAQEKGEGSSTQRSKESKSDSKKRRKRKSKRPQAGLEGKSESGAEGEGSESGSEPEQAERDAHDAGASGRDAEDAYAERRAPFEQPSTSGREAPGSLARRSAWKDGITYIGRLAIGPGIVGYGSSGTLVFEGSLDGRQVAVKRVLRQFYELARKEIGALIVADEHPNIVRCFAMEEDVEFVYLALERCKQSLNDVLGGDDAESRGRFVTSEGEVTNFCMQVCEEAGRGLLALHERGIVHRDLKPHNVLLTEGNRTKLSDMGLCKRLTTDQTSYDSAGPGGSTGWQAPEQLILRAGGEVRQGRSVDIFTFGLLVFYCMTGGLHAFGNAYERDYRILNGRANLDAVAKHPEATSLIRAMLRPQAKQRPSMASVMVHPFWWSPARKLAFLIDLSNRVENEDREVDRSLLQALESVSESALGTRDWASRLDDELLANLGRYRKYQPGSLRDLLRVIRNKHNHFREMPEELQEKLGPLPCGFLRYFTSRFPQLLLTTYAFALERCSEEPPLEQYFPPEAKQFPFATANLALKVNQPAQLGTGPGMLQGDSDRTSSAPEITVGGSALASIDELREATHRSKSETALLPPPPRPPHARPGNQARRHRAWWSSSESSERAESDVSSLEDRSQSFGSSASAGSGRGVSRFLDPAAYGSPDQHSPPQRLSNSSGTSSPAYLHAPRPPLPPVDATAFASPKLPPYQLDSGFPGGPPADGMGPSAGGPGVLTVPDCMKVTMLSMGVKQLRDSDSFVNVFPQRPENSECDFFLKTGHCKFGETCRFHHPLHASVRLTREGGYPMRPGMPVCPFYDRTGACKYAASCKFHHPPVPGCRSSDSSGHRGSFGSQPSSASG